MFSFDHLLIGAPRSVFLPPFIICLANTSAMFALFSSASKSISCSDEFSQEVHSPDQCWVVLYFYEEPPVPVLKNN